METNSEDTENREHRRKRTVVIWVLSSAVPIITLRLQARIANMARAFEQRTIVPLGRSCKR